MNKIWEIAPDASLQAGILSQETGVSPRLCRLLINRGLTEKEDVLDFLHSSGFHDPFLMKGMKEAVNRIRSALEKSERILVYGDYDADGITGTALLYLSLKDEGADVSFYIPRRADGYGLHREAIGEASRRGVSLLITVDCGSGSASEIAYAKELGIDVVVTDHHEVDSAGDFIMLNPRQADCPYPFKWLSGAGVVYKLLQGFCKEPPNGGYLALACLGTIGDVVSLTGENRVLARCGLEQLNKAPPAGISALLREARLSQRRIGSYEVGFILAPRLNAPGRLGSAEPALRLLLADSQIERDALAKEIERLNRRRQEMSRRIFEEAKIKLDRELDLTSEKIVVLTDASWQLGLVGNVASRLARELTRPVILIAMGEGDVGRGSARGIKGFHLLGALEKARGYLLSLGGHASAAGLSITADNILPFRKEINRIASSLLSDDDLRPRLKIDMEIEMDNIEEGFVEELDALEPYGQDNERPLFASYGVTVSYPRLVGKNHIKMGLRKAESTFSGIAFRMAPSHLSGLSTNKKVDIAYHLGMNEWQGRRSVQVEVVDMKSA